MILYPNGYFKKVSEITLEYLKENNIKGLILDVDNTLIDYYKNISDSTINWVNNMKQHGIRMCILSNSNNKEKVKGVADKLGLEYIYFGMKPLKFGFRKAKKMLDLESNEIAAVGDQIFTDILGANLMKMHSILVEPIAERDIFITLIKRPIENFLKRKYFERKTNKQENTNLNINLTEKINIDHNAAKIASEKKKNQRKSREEK